MLSIFKRKPDEVQSVYFNILEQARNPILYTDYGVPDTPYGRFQMIALHAAPYCIKYTKNRQEKKSQQLFDLIFHDVEQSFREIGVGDMSVPKKMRKYMRDFNGVLQAHAAKRADHVAITQRNLYEDKTKINTHFSLYIKGLFL